jgi:hypothetical protein
LFLGSTKSKAAKAVIKAHSTEELNPEDENQEEEEEEEDIEADENCDEASSDENEEDEDEDDVSESEEEEEVEIAKTNKKSTVKHTTSAKSTNKQRTTRPTTRLTPAQPKIGAKTTKTKTKKRTNSNTSTKGPPSKKVNYILNEDADEISVGTCVSGFSRKRYLIAPNYYIQVGDVDFGKNGGLMEALYIVKMKTNTSEEFRSHLPARLIPHLREGLTVLLDEDNTNNSG